MVSAPDIAVHDLELRHLEALRAVAGLGTFGRAATQLGYTQSAISQQIAALERIVGERVFDRPGGPKPVQLTAAGQMLLRHAEEVLDRVSLLARDLEGYKTGTTGRIDVGVFQSVAVKVVPTVVGRLRETSPGVDVRPFESRDDAKLVALVAGHELALTFTVAASPLDGVEAIDLGRDPFVAIVPRDHSSGDVLTLAAVQGSPMIGQPGDDSCQRKIDAGLTNAGVRPDYVFQTPDNAAAQAMVRAGMGVAIMPYLAVDTNDPDIRVCSLEPAIPARELQLMIGPEPSPVTRRFAQLTVEFCSEVLETAP